MSQQRANNILAQVMRLIEELVEDILLNIEATFKPDSVELRLKRLRHVYYNDDTVTVRHRRVKDILREKVSPEYYTFYERILAAERATYHISKDLHAGARTDELLQQMQHLGERIAALVEQLQNADRIIRLYPPESDNAASSQAAREWLLGRIEEALQMHGDIPAKVMSFTTVATDHSLARYSASIENLTNRLDDIADSYAEISQATPQRIQEFLANADDQA